MEQLQCIAQTYAWGKRGRSSIVAQLQESGITNFQVSQEQTYAELWMGSHPSGPARILRDGQPAELLSEWLVNHPAACGKIEANGELPFLFKVLSVEKALSIQAHPNSELAKQLHAKFPDVYKDPNHKPEMAIALTPFEALCQFRDINEIVNHLEQVSELQALAGEQVSQLLLRQRDQASLREYFKQFIHADHDLIASQLTSLQARLEAIPIAKRSPLETLILRLIEQYEPGEAVFLRANEPHAYLSGDCIECMACSDNVVRAGLTPKFIDKATLCDMLTYRTGLPSIQRGLEQNEGIRLYSSPVSEFEVEAITVSDTLLLPSRQGPSILLVLDGTGMADSSLLLTRGRVYIIPANTCISIQATSRLELYHAFPNESLEETK